MVNYLDKYNQNYTEGNKKFPISLHISNDLTYPREAMFFVNFANNFFIDRAVAIILLVIITTSIPDTFVIFRIVLI